MINKNVESYDPSLHLEELKKQQEDLSKILSDKMKQIEKLESVTDAYLGKLKKK
jgi:hypothetical protein